MEESTNLPAPQPPEIAGALEDTRRRLKRLESRDWWLWGTAVTVLLLIASALLVMQFPRLLHQQNLPQSRELDLAVRGLFALVALFSGFAIYQQVAIKRLRGRIASQIGTMAALEARAEVFEKLAILDPLTGLFNRRFATDHLPSEVARAERQGYPFTLLMIDLNGFKEINDVYGHAAGDQALREFAHALKKSVRSSDLPVRMGGDEFMALLPECRAYSVPECLARLKGLTITHNGASFQLKFSAGWCEWRPGESPEQLVERTDHAVYTDKRTGKAAEQVLRAEAHQREGQKLQVVGQMTGRVAHDFNNLMTVITGYSEMLLGAVEPNSPMRSQIENIRKAATNASQLTQQLLAFTRKTPATPKIVDLNHVLNDMEGLIRPLLGDRVNLVMDRGRDLANIQVSPAQLEQIVMSLVNNARDAIAGSGDITISTSNVILDNEFERTHAGARAGAYVRMVVSDSGAGMDAETLAHIFEPPLANAGDGKLKRPALMTLFGIVKQVGGYITAESELRRGSRLTVYFPQRVQPLQASLSGLDESAQQDKHTVLVVESVDTLREMTSEYLRSQGFHVLQAVNASDALSIAGSYHGPIILTVTDVVLPGTSCRELAALLTERRPRMKVLYIGGFAESGAAYEDIVRGPAYLESPFSIADFSRKIEEMVTSSALSTAAAE
jgi:diguanylate cyclase (GGDEF)-like protein